MSAVNLAVRETSDLEIERKSAATSQTAISSVADEKVAVVDTTGTPSVAVAEGGLAGWCTVAGW